MPTEELVRAQLDEAAAAAPAPPVRWERVVRLSRRRLLGSAIGLVVTGAALFLAFSIAGFASKAVVLEGYSAEDVPILGSGSEPPGADGNENGGGGGGGEPTQTATPTTTPSATATQTATPDQLVEVPRVVGRSKQAAGEILRREGLVLVAAKDCAPDVRRCRVVRQDPDQGERVTKGRRVAIELSGDAFETVPEVIGERPSSAERLILGADLIPEAPVCTSMACRVQDQHPDPFETAPRGSSVRLTYGALVPDVIGERPRAAVDLVQAALLTSDEPECPYGDACRVLSQDPEAEELVDLQDEVELTPGVLVEDLDGRTRQSAVVLLSGLGLKADPSECEGDCVVVGHEEKVVALGSTVELTLEVRVRQLEQQ